MHYALLLFENEAGYGADDSPEMLAAMEAHGAFAEKHGAIIRGGAGLKTSPSATTLSRKNGEIVLHDGPFAELKEQLGGFYLIEVDDLDAAIAVARDIPLDATGSVEIRPLLPETA